MHTCSISTDHCRTGFFGGKRLCRPARRSHRHNSCMHRRLDTPMTQPLVTAIVSTYNAERFIRGCLEDLVAQTMLSEMEVLVIDSGSLQGESAICEAFARLHPQVRLIRTQREPLYFAWNRAIGLARGKYLTNANTDDRHRCDFMEIMAACLEKHADVALVYADQFISHTENETFEQCERRDARIRRWPDFTPQDLMLRCITGSQPMWRKDLHDGLGVFDTGYRIAADYDMWLRFAGKQTLKRVPSTLGVFFDSPETISGSRNRLQMDREGLTIKKSHMTRVEWHSLPGIQKSLAAALFSTGYWYVEHKRDAYAAEPFIRESIRLDPWTFRYIKTYLIRCLPYIRQP